MASQGGTTLLEQFQEMLRRNRSKLQAKTIAAVNGMIPDWMGMLIDTVAGFENVTGNTITGFFVGAYIPINGKMTLVGTAISGDFMAEPTRPWLKKGEVYNRPYYYGGVPVYGKPYVGKTGDRNEDSYDEAMRFLQSHAPSHAPLAFLVGNSVDYASYLEVHNKANLITKFADDRKAEGWIVKMHGKN
jgi:hypothetical protein